MIPLVLMMTLSAAPEAWRARGEPSGFKLETRGVTNSAHEEIRLTARSVAPPDRVCAAVWGGGRKKLGPGFKRQDVLLETDVERLTYEQINAPLVSDRDYTLLVQRTPAPNGDCRVTFQTQNERGPAPQKGFVRISAIRGSWDIRALPSGQTEIIYTVYSEPGGSIPAFLSRGPTRDKAVEFLKVILSRVEEAHARR